MGLGTRCAKQTLLSLFPCARTRNYSGPSIVSVDAKREAANSLSRDASFLPPPDFGSYIPTTLTPEEGIST
jgi:hypothetical protein